MRIACWIPKATNTQSENVIIIVFPLQQRLRERAYFVRTLHVLFLYGNRLCVTDIFLENANPFPLHFPSHVVIYYLRMTAVIY